ncbi:MAG: RNA polymerase sigma factor [Oscillospiraceae bacterium]|nr:RNA polymerase sigma factor [Oscillospiraceae bacterium]
MKDDEILALLEQRDEGAIRALKTQYGALCTSIALHILGDQQDAEECVSDMLFRVWNAVPPEQPEKLSAYCAALTRNLALNRYHAQNAQRRGGGQTPVVLEELQECIPAGNDTEQVIGKIALSDALARFLRGQSAKARRVFLLRYFSMQPVAQIAEELNLKENTVKSILKRTRDALRASLEKEELL